MNKIKKVNEFFFMGDKDDSTGGENTAPKGAALNFLGEVNEMIKQFNDSTENLDAAYDGLCNIMSKYMKQGDFQEFINQCKGYDGPPPPPPTR